MKRDPKPVDEMTSAEKHELAQKLRDQARSAPRPDPEHYPTLPVHGETLSEAEIVELEEDAKQARGFALAAFKLEGDNK